MDLETRICRVCGKPYVREHSELFMCKECEKDYMLKVYGKKIKHCVICDKPFEAKANNSKYCCEECKKEANALKARERRRQEKKNKVYKCGYCLKEFKPKHSNQKYCCEECRELAEKQKEKIARYQRKRAMLKQALNKRPDLKDKPRDKSYKIRSYVVKVYRGESEALKSIRDYNYFKPCKFDKNNENLYYIHDFNDDLSNSLIKFSNTTLSEKEFEYYNSRGNLVFYEMLT